MIATYAFGFNILQANNISTSIAYYVGENGVHTGIVIPIIIGAIMVLLTGYIILGGQQKIVSVTSWMVPIMAGMYLLISFAITIKNVAVIPDVISLIVSEALDFKAIFGGFAGSCVLIGVKRGWSSNEAGVGSSPNTAASANVSHPVKQGLVQILSVYIDTIIICTATGSIVLLSGVDLKSMRAMPLVLAAVESQFGPVGAMLVTISVVMFAYSSVIGNCYNSEANVLFIRGRSSKNTGLKIAILCGIFVGCLVGNDLVWDIADILMGIMAIVNFIAIFLLRDKAMRVFKDYMRQKKEGKDPVFLAENVGITDCECWK